MEQDFFSNVLEMKDINSFPYQFEVWTTLQSTWIEFKIINWNQIHWMEFELNWIGFQLHQIEFNSWIQIQLKINGTQVGRKEVQNWIVNIVFEKII
jgi:hypothetical protein